MARTAHHVPWRHWDDWHDNHAATRGCFAYPSVDNRWRIVHSYRDCDHAGATHTVRDLRYSAAALATAEAAGTRPVPEPVTASFDIHQTYGRVYASPGMLAWMANRDERATRAKARTALIGARGYANAALADRAWEDAFDDAWDDEDCLHVPAPRHRRSAITDWW